ncbi:MAG: glycosyltransferase [Sphingomonas sp.]
MLYLTQDGITDFIGQAQIAPYVLGLARKGHEIHVISAEKTGREALKVRYQATFAEAGVRWSFVPYANRPPLVSSVWVLWRMYRLAIKVAQVERPAIIHCRSYLPFELGVRLKRRFGARLLLDFRDFWPDLRLETSRFKLVYRGLKRREPTYFGAADHVVTLTERGADVLHGRYPGALHGRRDGYTVIPCCADFDLFDPGRVDRRAVERHRRELGLEPGQRILVYLGSLGPDYLLREMLILFRQLLEIDPSAKFVFVSNNAADAVAREREVVGIPAEAVRFVSVERAQVPEYIALADLSVIFVRRTPAKAGGSPTKLAELFALNVPVIANAGVGDLDAIIDFERNGSVVIEDFEPATLRAALERVLSHSRSAARSIRDSSREFSLDEGVNRYNRVYEKLSPSSVEDGSGLRVAC